MSIGYQIIVGLIALIDKCLRKEAPDEENNRSGASIKRRDGPMDEHRKHQRHKTFKGASISHDRVSGVTCVVRNLSQGGACLEVDRPNDLPDDFTLIIKPECVKRYCRIARRSVARVGVSFS